MSKIILILLIICLLIIAVETFWLGKLMYHACHAYDYTELTDYSADYLRFYLFDERIFDWECK